MYTKERNRTSQFIVTPKETDRIYITDDVSVVDEEGFFVSEMFKGIFDCSPCAKKLHFLKDYNILPFERVGPADYLLFQMKDINGRLGNLWYRKNLSDPFY